jgi:hypothetical protein
MRKPSPCTVAIHALQAQITFRFSLSIPFESPMVDKLPNQNKSPL